MKGSPSGRQHKPPSGTKAVKAQLGPSQGGRRGARGHYRLRLPARFLRPGREAAAGNPITGQLWPARASGTCPPGPPPGRPPPCVASWPHLFQRWPGTQRATRGQTPVDAGPGGSPRGRVAAGVLLVTRQTHFHRTPPTPASREAETQQRRSCPTLARRGT